MRPVIQDFYLHTFELVPQKAQPHSETVLSTLDGAVSRPRDAAERGPRSEMDGGGGPPETGAAVPLGSPRAGPPARGPVRDGPCRWGQRWEPEPGAPARDDHQACCSEATLGAEGKNICPLPPCPPSKLGFSFKSFTQGAKPRTTTEHFLAARKSGSQVTYRQPVVYSWGINPAFG